MDFGLGDWISDFGLLLGYPLVVRWERQSLPPDSGGGWRGVTFKASLPIRGEVGGGLQVLDL